MSKRFSVAISYASEQQEYVGKVAESLANVFTRDRILFDQFHLADFARPNLDTHLARLYQESDFIIVFLSAAYVAKNWPSLEFRVVREQILKKTNDRVMILKFEGTPENVEGLLAIDNRLSLQGMSAAETARLILTRVLSGYSGIGNPAALQAVLQPAKSNVVKTLIKISIACAVIILLLIIFFQGELDGEADKMPTGGIIMLATLYLCSLIILASLGSAFIITIIRAIRNR
jgi:hypothetical protein